MSAATVGGEPVAVLRIGSDGWLLVRYPDGDEVWTPPHAVVYPEEEAKLPAHQWNDEGLCLLHNMWCQQHTNGVGGSWVG